MSHCPDLPTVNELGNLYVLDSLKGFGPQSFKQIHKAGIPVAEILREPALMPMAGKRAETIRAQLVGLNQASISTCMLRAEKQLSIAHNTNSLILTYRHSIYPKHVFESNNPIPVLYVRGDASALMANRTVACVGSRKIREPYKPLHASFARAAIKEGFAIVSGFALGADTVGHEAAVEAGGMTICVMPSGLDRPFPPEHKELWQRFLSTKGVVFTSEFPFGTGAASLNLRKRNKTIVAFSQGVLVSQTSKTGGTMNAYRFAIEQKKPIATLLEDASEDTSGNHLIASALEPKATVFGLMPFDEKEQVLWLRGLLSST